MLAKGVRTLVIAAAVATLVGCGSGSSDPLSAATGVAPRSIDPKIVPPIEIGMNLAAGGAFSAAPVTANLIAAHGGLWLVGSGGWDFESKAIARDAGGHPIEIAKGSMIVVAVRPKSLDRRFRDITCSIDPGWEVDLLGGGRKIGDDTHFRIVSNAAPGAPVNVEVTMRLTARQAGASLLQADCREEGVARDMLADPDAIADAKPFRVIRFMDWMATNGADYRTWADRARPTDFNQTTPKGVAVEYLVDLANHADADPWFTMPFEADDAYYRNFAIYARDHVAPGHKIYVELSNEVWNTGFRQAQEATEKGQAAYPAAKDKGNDYYYADRVRAVMAIWGEVFAAQRARLVRVASVQAVWPARAEDILGHKETWRSLDMLASAPYFGTNGFEVNTSDPTARIDALFAAGPQAVDAEIKHALEAKAIAAKYGLRYGTYEGGPGYINGMPEMQKQLNDLNRDPRIYALYSLFLKRWADEVGGLYMAFNSVGEFGQYGPWGHKEFRDATLSEAPKLRALIDAIAAHPSAGKAAN